ncbi:MAG: hypothetical protein ACREDU_08270, partial [Methylocella sp.]
IWAFLAIRRLARDELTARRRVGELEVRLNETEAAIAAEAHVLIIWRGREDIPDRVMGSMHGAAHVPASAEELLRFESWLEHDSLDALTES